jgi:hypothetical protein
MSMEEAETTREEEVDNTPVVPQYPKVEVTKGMLMI